MDNEMNFAEPAGEGPGSEMPEIPPHLSVPHWVIVSMTIIAVIGYFMVSYVYALWPFGSLLPPLPPLSPVTNIGSVPYYTPYPEESLGVDITPSPTPGMSDTSTWKTYTNSQYGFSFMYPGDWIEDKIGSDGEVTSLSSPETIKERKNCVEGCGPDISFNYHLNIRDLRDVKYNGVKAQTLYDYVHSGNGAIINVEPIIISGQSGFDMVYAGESGVYAILIQKDSHIYEIIFDNAFDKNQLSTTDNQILSTFKFIQ